ncbi:MAG: VWA domain-containing protein [Lentisphaeria bacterium]|nr:VWA domain-containing protein [Lentisphaeria bacterium]
MDFIHPEYLYGLLVIVPAMAAVYGWAAYRRRRGVEMLGGSQAAGMTDVSRGKRRLRFLLLLLTAVLLLIAAARPWWGRRTVSYVSTGRDILVIFDVSKSMLATDVAPSRLKHAQYLLTQLVEANKGDRFGLIAFAGQAFLECPLTSDYISFLQFVDDLSPTSIPLGGTNVERALAVAADAFQAAGGHYRAVILMTDGDELTGDSSRMIKVWRERQVPLIVVGLGDPDVPALVPEADGSYKRDAAGELVKTRLAEAALKQLAVETGGLYVRSTAADSQLNVIDNRIKQLIPENSGENGVRSLPVERFVWFLAAAWLLLLIYLMTSDRRSRIALTAVLLMGISSWAGPSEPEPPLPDDPVALYNLALEKQRAGDAGHAEIYAAAIRQGADVPEVRSRSFFNLGTGSLQTARAGVAAARQALTQQQLPVAKQQLEKCRGDLKQADELYGQAMMQPAGDTEIPEWAAGNLQKLADTSEEVEELLKKIQELERQQQQAQDQTRQAQQQNQQNQQNQQSQQNQQNQSGQQGQQNQQNQQNQQDQQDQQNQSGQQGQQNQQDQQNQQNQSGQQNQQDQPDLSRQMQQARESAEQLAEQAKDLEQQQLKESAERAAEEIRQAENAHEAGKNQEAGKHLEAALRELGGDQQKPQDRKDRQDQSGQPDQKDQKDQQKPQEPSGQPDQQNQPEPSQMAEQAPASPGKPEPDREAARKMLELMAGQEKELREALKENAARRMPKVEKDW